MLVKLKGIARYIVDNLVERTIHLGQGRGAGCFAFVDSEGYISACTETEGGGLTGLPLRRLLSRLISMEGLSILEGLKNLPENTVFVATSPGRTGLITDIHGVDIFNLPIVSIGVKEDGMAGVGVIYPRSKHFNLATEREQLDLATLSTRDMEEEREVLRKNNLLGLKYLEVSEELPVQDLPEQPPVGKKADGEEWQLPRHQIKSLDQRVAESIVQRSMEIGQGREVALIGRVDDGHVIGDGEPVNGGIGYVPSRVLASSAVDITGKSLREIYAELVSVDAVIVHTHPGGTGVMHIGDASAGPGTWGRPIIAVGHDRDGRIRGATVVEHTSRLFELADEDESLGLKFFEAETADEEAEIRNRKFGIAQEYTDLCKPIEIV
ncbi:MAG: peptidase S7 [Bacillota bacterium]